MYTHGVIHFQVRHMLLFGMTESTHSSRRPRSGSVDFWTTQGFHNFGDDGGRLVAVEMVLQLLMLCPYPYSNADSKGQP